MNYLLLLLGLLGLWFGTELTIRGALSLSKRVGLSEFVVGIVILAVGSDLPELAIAIDVAIKGIGNGGASDVVVGSALGSTLGQIGFVLGIAGLMATLMLRRRTVFRHGLFLLGSIVLLALFARDGDITRVEGIILILVYVVYLMLVIADSANYQNMVEGAPPDGLAVSIVLLLVGLVIVTISADVTVEGAINVATSLGVSEAVVAILIVGLGTSLPELSISIAAVLKGRERMSVGNLIGSNIFDTLVPIGAAATISGVSFSSGFRNVELPFLFVLTTVVLLLFLRKMGIRKLQAVIVLAMYCGYAGFKIAGA
ncbi:MAG: sodium:calcium antiporter [Woeseiaceae bacterium]